MSAKAVEPALEPGSVVAHPLGRNVTLQCALDRLQAGRPRTDER
jgi:hypothetical protein